MTDGPPSSNPAAGWYPDPEGDDRYRWWDGAAWTESVSSAGGPPPGQPEPPPSFPPPPPFLGQSDAAAVGAPPTVKPLGAIGDWLSESFRLSAGRAGHFLPMILLFVISIGIPTAFATWYGLRDTVITIDQATAEVDFSYGGSSAWAVAALISLPVTALMSYVLRGAVTRQAWMAHMARVGQSAGDPQPGFGNVEREAPVVETWSESLQIALSRWRRVVGSQLVRSLLYWVIGVGALLATGLSPVFILLLPLAAVAIFVLWIRLAFVGTVAVLGGPDDRPFKESRRLSGLHFGPLTGRLILLAIVSAFLILVAGIIGSPFTAIAGAGQQTSGSPPDTIRFNDLLGANVFVFALGSLFNSLGVGANYVMATVGTTLLYRKLGGAVPPDTEQ